MIDTIKIFTNINKNIYDKIHSNSIIKTSFHNATGEIIYNIVNNSLEGAYNSSLSIRIGNGDKYNFLNSYYIEIEGSYHKLIRGYNSHNGFNNLVSISLNLIRIVENTYKIKLPNIKHWFLQRADIAICFDLNKQENVETYINNLSCCNFPKRKLKYYENESIYITGNTTTIKIYNKLKEFIKNDKKNFKDTKFDIDKYLQEINGFIRFECEIKKSKLVYVFKKKYIRILNITYSDLKKIWYEEFQKFFKIAKNDIKIIKDKEVIKEQLFLYYNKVRANNLYNFYLLIKMEGLQEIKKRTNKSMYYKNIKDLKKVGIDFSQKLDLNLNDTQINFNPFEAEEIL